MTPKSPSRDPFAALRGLTRARIGLGRAGQALPTAPLLAFQLAHARAVDAVHADMDATAIQAALGRPSLVVASAAPDRRTYLQDPEQGRRLDPGASIPQGLKPDLAIVIADGLSATAVNAHAATLVAALDQRLTDWTLAPIVLARQARVALGDPIGERLGARCVVVLIGERPGLSAADSLGAYITWSPKPGLRDSERNCVSNIGTDGGLTLETAADKIAWLLNQARRLGLTGVDLKDRHGQIALPSTAPCALPPEESA
ncbi:ethanolamine ammonia-lyase subunit EutC [Caulobacter segnis]|uniref:Ethanolamine ammonia-lyase small subunit n=1 Tax=Caulobacter segnis TaxID=88688 RepID=A0A2W5UYX8_9CAUL|nr:ethanolamine ammonia-lyase subunit EutC [Caulobacter segnis]PZR32830.1 MAG: ethanolamine ammonia-lyase [Caulobacter segnis]